MMHLVERPSEKHTEGATYTRDNVNPVLDQLLTVDRHGFHVEPSYKDPVLISICNMYAFSPILLTGNVEIYLGFHLVKAAYWSALCGLS